MSKKIVFIVILLISISFLIYYFNNFMINNKESFYIENLTSDVNDYKTVDSQNLGHQLFFKNKECSIYVPSTNKIIKIDRIKESTGCGSPLVHNGMIIYNEQQYDDKFSRQWVSTGKYFYLNTETKYHTELYNNADMKNPLIEVLDNRGYLLLVNRNSVFLLKLANNSYDVISDFKLSSPYDIETTHDAAPFYQSGLKSVQDIKIDGDIIETTFLRTWEKITDNYTIKINTSSKTIEQSFTSEE